MRHLALFMLSATLLLPTACRRPSKGLEAGAGGGHRAPEDQDKDQGKAQEPPNTQAPLCDGDPCPAPKRCISYFGIAGPSGPTFHACELPCERGSGDNDGCPADARCVTIADGPGDVCRPVAAE